MFTLLAFVLIGGLAFWADRANNQDRSSYGNDLDEKRGFLLGLHIRQDLKLIAFLLGGVLIMLGVIADRV